MMQRMPVLFDWLMRFALHIATGVLAVAVHYALMAVLLQAGTRPVLASSLGFIAGAITRFFTAYYNVYAPTGTVRSTVPRFVLALGAQFILNSALLAGLIEIDVAVWWAQLATTVLLTFGNYIVYRLWVFR